MNGDKVAVCGLICEGCEIMKAKEDKKIAKRISKWFKENIKKEVKIEDIRCGGCRGDRKIHWSPDCWILKCCYDDRGFDFCYQCPDFPCDRLSEWAAQCDKYGEALERLEEMKERNAGN